MKEKDITAYCGLYCGDCIRYKSRVSELADELLNEIDKHHFTEYANVKRAHTKEFENFESFTALLKAISGINCEIPCGFKGCWECNNFERCDLLDFLKPFHGDGPLKNLRKIKELGIDNWSKNREKCYPWL